MLQWTNGNAFPQLVGQVIGALMKNRADSQTIWAFLSYFDGGNGAAPVPVIFEAKLDPGNGSQPIIPKHVRLIAGTAYLYSPFFTGFVRLDKLAAFAKQVERFRIGVTNLPGTRQQRYVPPKVLSVGRHPNQDQVVIGVIDHGIAFLNKAFLGDPVNGALHSRIERFWDQQRGYPAPPPAASAQAQGASGGRVGSWKPLKNYGYGRELVNVGHWHSIDYWLNCGAPEAEVYRTLQYGPAQGVRAHGTHVLGAAAGATELVAGGLNDAASKCPIIAVQLPATPHKDTSGTGLGVQVLDAVSYIAMHAAGRRFVINLSDGGYSGPHDGTSLLERALDRVFRDCYPERALVVAAGNQFDQRLHWRGNVPANGKAESLVWNVLPDDDTDSHLEIWPQAPSEDAFSKHLTVEVTTPTAQVSGQVSVGQVGVLVDSGGANGNKTIAAVIFVADSANASGGGKRPMIHVAMVGSNLAPTKRPPAPHGKWLVQLFNSGGKPIGFDAYIGRDNPALGDKGPSRQSHLVHPSYPRAACLQAPPLDDSGNSSPIVRMGNLNSVATAAGVVAVGGFVQRGARLAAYSAGGPGRALPKAGVDCIAPSDTSVHVKGVLGVGVRSGTSFRMDGTSVAAPYVTRKIANVMVHGVSSGVALPACSTWAQRLSANVPTGTPPVPGPGDRVGVGRV